ncbi:putative replication protein [Roseobacter sp. SK209-2-6]|uniref:helix-turn-helix domain-containing protein n=1 Tax=Roseobacter sp. SK209-2-6 TaxID=388739 RepID=UPI0000F3C5AA|nr:helix-turn-helix domain-containing protein [Roseobacter sp. SK209-2-6]EBA18378.1 putative replication protein [Roseobacter sp. SK209-2-6]
MSIEMYSLIKRRVAGSPTKKAILLYMADAASDDGSGIWVSKGNMAADLEMKSKRTVQTNIAELVAAGILSEVGQRKCKNGFTIEYRINVDAVSSLPQTRAGNAPLPQHIAGAGNAPVQEMHLTGAGDAPPPVQEMHPNHPLNHKGTMCPADTGHTQPLDLDFGPFFDEVWRLCPRQDSWSQTEEAVKAVIDGGAVPADVLGATRAYAKRTAGHDPSRIKYSQNFFADGFWEQFVPKRAAKVDQAEILRRRAADIIAGKSFLTRSISAHAAGECITAGLVTAEQCRDAGINL